jgi:hypothetical protein
MALAAQLLIQALGMAMSPAELHKWSNGEVNKARQDEGGAVVK